MLDLHKIASQLVYNSKDPLLFNSGFFLIFFIVFLFGYLLVHKKPMVRILYFTLFSFYFFYKACGFYFILILISAVVDFTLSNLIYSASSDKKKKILLVISVIINLGLLAYFKYTNFFIEIINDVTNGNIQPLKLLLPIGISFYTFENLSYTIDVYRGKFTPVKSFLDYCFFLSFFPKLVMGPIVRASDFIPQIRKNILITPEYVSGGLYLILSGLFKKVVISDYIYVNFVQYIFDDPSRHSGIECLLGVYGYAMVIYCDFSGYSDMAIGIAKWVGIDININFNSPYQSSSITEFWRRWHISLSSWFRDYLYFPLGGSRSGKWMAVRNTFIIFLVSGFWHGASWKYVTWGFVHACGFLPLLLIGKNRTHVLDVVAEHRKFPSAKEFLQMLWTFTFVTFAWIFFRADGFTEAIGYIKSIFINHANPAEVFLYKKGLPLVAVLLFCDWLFRRDSRHINFGLKNMYLRLLVYAIVTAVVLIYFCVNSTIYGTSNFIYFQF
jgi:D-alanyl-lipoteichoic acid acyltransferase DltB (MBOAT superfamily)